jgi:trk system potassium uptake protein TrkH
VLAGSVLLIAVYLVARHLPGSLQALRMPPSTWCRSPPPPAMPPYDYAQWPLFAPMLMILLGCFATCAGSTGGGIKMIRMLLLLKQARRELVRIVHPRAVNAGGAGWRGGRRPQDAVRDLAFMLIYGAVIWWRHHAAAVQRAGRGDSAFTAVIACVNNTGPGLGEVGPAVNFQGLSDFQTWVCSSPCCWAGWSCCQRCWCCSRRSFWRK